MIKTLRKRSLASQFVHLQPDLLAALLENTATLAAALCRRNIEIELLDHPGARQSLAVLADRRNYGLGARRMSRPCRFALCLVPAGEIPARRPQPLPDQSVLDILAVLERAISELPDLTAHEVMAIGEAFNAARDGVAIGPRTVVSLPASTPRQRRLLHSARRLNLEFGPELEALDSKLESYRALAEAADLEATVARLSCHAELGRRLHVEANDGGAGLVAGLRTSSRHSGIGESIEVAVSLGDATLCLLERHDPYDANARPLRNSNDVVAIYCWATGVTWKRLKARQLAGLGERIHPRRTVPVPGTIAIGYLTPSLNGWIDDFDERRWLEVHPIVRATMAHAEFVRMRPFPRGNGRTARLLSAIQLREADWPAIPLEAAFEHLYGDYQASVLAMLRAGGYGAMLQLILSACRLAIELAQQMIGILVPERTRLIQKLCNDPVTRDGTRIVVEHLLSGILVEDPLADAGSSSERTAFLRLVHDGTVDIVNTPVGALYSLRIVRELMANLLGVHLR